MLFQSHISVLDILAKGAGHADRCVQSQEDPWPRFIPLEPRLLYLSGRLTLTIIK
jgi:hypothetical protein